MRTATDKNFEALTKIFGSSEVASRVQATRLRIVTTEISDTESGRLLAEAIGEVLGRLWINFDVEGPLSGAVTAALRTCSESGAKPLNLTSFGSGTVDATIFLAPASNTATLTDVFVGANGWSVTAGTAVNFGHSRIPVGPAFAAGLAGAEVFKIIFRDCLIGRDVERLADLELNLWPNGQGVEPSETTPLNLGRTHFFGIGAVTHGLMWSLERWPASVAGELVLVDHDVYDASNGQRYAGLRVEDLGAEKAVVISSRLMSAHKGVVAVPFATNLDDYFDQYEPLPSVALAVVGLDSPEARRHAALKLPRRGINMWTESMHLGSSRFGGWDQWPCLMCQYPEALKGERDQVAVVFLQLQQLTRGQPTLEPRRIRELLDNLELLSDLEARMLAPWMNQPAEALVGKPLSSVLQHLCATATVQVVQDREVDVPLAFSSMMAGTAGFINLVAELQTGEDAIPTDWQYQLLGKPSVYLHTPVFPRTDCFLCACPRP